MTKPGPHPPLRAETHRTDTLAVRKVLSALSADWIVRDLSERDYGIDLMVERYAGDMPTGQIVFLQIKGTAAPVRTASDVVKFQLPKRTLLYAERFSEPFFLIHTSTDRTSPIYFVWLQKYISHRLDKHATRWRTQPEETINIDIPAENTFSEAESKLGSIASESTLARESMQFLSTYLFWELDYGEFTGGNGDYAPICAQHLNRLMTLNGLFARYEQGCPDLEDALQSLEAYPSITDRDLGALAQLNDHLDRMKTSILTRHHDEEFAEEVLGELPY
jgi:hypothetical protein